eukprot:403366823
MNLEDQQISQEDQYSLRRRIIRTKPQNQIQSLQQSNNREKSSSDLKNQSILRTALKKKIHEPQYQNSVRSSIIETNFINEGFDSKFKDQIEKINNNYIKFQKPEDVDDGNYRSSYSKYLTFRFQGYDVKLVKDTLENNKFIDLTLTQSNQQDEQLLKFKNQNQNSQLLLWSTCMIKSNVYQNLTINQKVNHFPRSYEITRKDLFYQRISRMQALFGFKNYDFVPLTFQYPQEITSLQQEMQKRKEQLWIFKPCASSQGKGIFVTQNLDQIPLKQNFIVSEYVKNPYLINGLKFDLRIYVAVTSINPLRVYIYEEGLTRFATQKYNNNDLSNLYVHLTNYSINKFNSEGFIPNQNPDLDNTGSKWSLSALKNFLLKNFKQNQVDSLNDQINDMVIKTIIAVEPLLQNGIEMFLLSKNKQRTRNCFELLGFDVLIDQNLKPWLLEVNLSPSMNTDSPLDLKIKSQLLIDLFNLVGIYSEDSTMNAKSSNKSESKKPKTLLSDRGNLLKRNFLPKMYKETTNVNQIQQQKIEQKLIIEMLAEYERKGNFKRLFPTENYNQYKLFFDEEKLNDKILGDYLINERIKSNYSHTGQQRQPQLQKMKYDKMYEKQHFRYGSYTRQNSNFNTNNSNIQEAKGYN